MEPAVYESGGDHGRASDEPGGARVVPIEPPSVLVLTKNEEINIARCLETLSFSDDIVVLDSHSDDRTCEIAESFANVRVVKRDLDTWSRHSNWALENIEFRHPWVYYSDADERIPAALRDEMLRVINDPDLPEVAYRLRYKNMFMGRWIRRGGIYPVWIIRLYRPDKVRYEDREVNAHPVVDGALGELREHFTHFSFNKGMGAWFDKHNAYSTMEASEASRVLDGSMARELMAVLRAREPLVRRRALKNVSFFLPMRMLARFGYMYLLRLGMLDLRAGLNYAAMISMYEYWIDAKVREARNDWSDKTSKLADTLLMEGAA